MDDALLKVCQDKRLWVQCNDMGSRLHDERSPFDHIPALGPVVDFGSDPAPALDPHPLRQLYALCNEWNTISHSTSRSLQPCSFTYSPLNVQNYSELLAACPGGHVRQSVWSIDVAWMTALIPAAVPVG
ncbi:hypothetical protein EVAR_85472_1 [Eumeta japonica]|uniref:Uncharacterized protein n=1 Tax=Eumeta variegata TaxID=151549 RepID=A0A4C1VEZ8_EUMVA|nr:hypothetical protein EVAR_85472_1 [Eumeta japonica]